MKISKLFHWLYALLMLLPFASAFAIGLVWVFNPNVDIPTITENVSKEIDFNQIYNVNGISLTVNGITGSVDSGAVSISGVSEDIGNGPYFGWTNFNVPIGHKFAFKIDFDLPNGSYLMDQYNGNYNSNILEDGLTSQFDFLIPQLRVLSGGITFDISDGHICVFDLSQMFGLGNEPTIAQFNEWFPDDYYSYTKSTHLVIDDYSTKETYDNPINYIWLPSFGGMGWSIKNVFTFMFVNMFGISVSYGIGYTLVYLLTYWLCISLIWLIYDVIMYVPLMIHRWLDKGVIS